MLCRKGLGSSGVMSTPQVVQPSVLARCQWIVKWIERDQMRATKCSQLWAFAPQNHAKRAGKFSLEKKKHRHTQLPNGSCGEVIKNMELRSLQWCIAQEWEKQAKKNYMGGSVIDYQGGIFTLKTVKQRNRLPRQAVPSLLLMESQDPSR